MENQTNMQNQTDMSTQNVDNLVRRNRKYAKCFDDGDLSHIPAKRYAVVTCMDCRIDPALAFGINLGDAHVIRNAGGSAREELRSLVISQQFLQTNEIFVIKHTHCGMLGLTNDSVNQVVAKNLGPGALAELRGLDWRGFSDLEQAVRDDVAFLHASKAIPDYVKISGWIYDVETGRVSSVRQ